MHPWIILCDFDGTISTCDVTDEILARFARPGWERLEDSWRQGRIGSRECMRGQVALLEASADQINQLLDGVQIDPAFPVFVAAAQAAGAALVIVSDGLDWAIRRILARHGLGHLPVIANQLMQSGQGWQMRSPNASGDCSSGTCKCACAERAAATPGNTLLIGDGQSDFCVSGDVDFVFAIGKLAAHCRQQGVRFAPIAGFEDAIALLPDLLAGRFTHAGALPGERQPQRMRTA